MYESIWNEPPKSMLPPKGRYDSDVPEEVVDRIEGLAMSAWRSVYYNANIEGVCNSTRFVGLHWDMNDMKEQANKLYREAKHLEMLLQLNPPADTVRDYIQLLNNISADGRGWAKAADRHAIELLRYDHHEHPFVDAWRDISKLVSSPVRKAAKQYLQAS